MSEAPTTILVVAGPTATGKTAAALALGRRLGGELVGADSVQVYRGFDIGSSKPTAAELAGVPHHLLDVADPDQPLDAMRYAELADAAIAGIARSGRLPIVVGGTGLWLRALLRGLVELPVPDPALRARLDEEVSRLGAPALHARLAAVDPRAASAVHPHDALRIVRALEVLEQTGEPLGDLRHRHALGGPRYRALVLALDRPSRDELGARIDARLDAMLAAGWLDEVRGLLARWGPDVRPLGSVGYREIAGHLRGQLSLAEAIEQARRATRVLTRRQRTWLSSDPDVSFRTTAEELGRAEAIARIERFVAGGGA